MTCVHMFCVFTLEHFRFLFSAFETRTLYLIFSDFPLSTLVSISISECNYSVQLLHQKNKEQEQSTQGKFIRKLYYDPELQSQSDINQTNPHHTCRLPYDYSFTSRKP